MAKRTRLRYQAANEFGTALSKTADYTLTSADILKDGYQFIKLSSDATLTLPAASLDLSGITIRVFFVDADSAVYVAAGFGGGSTSYDVVQGVAYCTIDFWCSGTYWYAKTLAVTNVVV